MASSLITVSFFVVTSRAHIATTENYAITSAWNLAEFQKNAGRGMCSESLSVVASQNQPQYTIVLIIGTLK